MLPAEKEDNVLDVSLKHIVLAFTSIVVGTALVGASIVLVRDHIRFKRQKAFFDNFTNLITHFGERSSIGEKS
jgi:hypothetical protein